MIIVQLIGGLGNQLFQYAFGRALELKLNRKVYFDISGFEKYNLRKFELEIFKVKLDVAPIQKVKQLRSYKNRFINKFSLFLDNHSSANKLFYREKRHSYDPDVFKTSGHTYFEGYWQTEKYFSIFRDQLLNELTIVNPPSTENQKLINKIKSNNSVSLHIRRGDYISNKTNQLIHGTCSLNYYNNAMNKIKDLVEDPLFFVFSDDITWVKNNINDESTIVFVDINDSDNAYEDMRLMSYCKHNIIANSSFSWWGAWLNQNLDKKVIAPSRWFVDHTVDYSDVVPDNWIKLQNF